MAHSQDIHRCRAVTAQRIDLRSALLGDCLCINVETESGEFEINLYGLTDEAIQRAVQSLNEKTTETT